MLTYVIEEYASLHTPWDLFYTNNAIVVNASVEWSKEAEKKKDFVSTKSKSGIHRFQHASERQLGSLKSVIGTITRDGGTPSVDSIATELSAMPIARRAFLLMGLQLTNGNRYVQRVVAQAKLMVGPAGDKYEREADRVADEVVREISTSTVQSIQRQDVKGEEEEELLQGKFTSGLTGTLQAKPEAPPNKTGMPDQLKLELENLSRMSMDDVKVHYNSPKPQQLNALAYTQGQDIHVAPGQAATLNMLKSLTNHGVSKHCPGLLRWRLAQPNLQQLVHPLRERNIQLYDKNRLLSGDHP